MHLQIVHKTQSRILEGGRKKEANQDEEPNFNGANDAETLQV